MTANYTKGNWELELRANDNIIRIKSTPPNSFQTHQIGEVYGTHGEDMANARLITSAPALYEALKLYQKHQEGSRGHYCSECHQAIDKAIAKAEGIKP